MKPTNLELLEPIFSQARAFLVDGHTVSTSFYLGFLSDDETEDGIEITIPRDKNAQWQTYHIDSDEINTGELIEGGVKLDYCGQELTIVALGVIKEPKSVSSEIQDYAHEGEPIKTTVELGEVDGQLVVKAEGYGDCNSEKGFGCPVVIENAYGSLQLRVWADINKEDPTHVISLENAKESNFKG